MMTKDEQRAIEQYLKTIGINTMEFFEEMYDHISTSFENRGDVNQTLQEHIRTVVQPAFGGVNGITSIQNQRMKMRIRLVRKRFGQLFMQYFLGWPTVLVTLAIISIVLIGQVYFGSKALFIFIFICVAAIPVFFFFGSWFQFWLRCRKENKPYRNSEKFTVISPIAALLLQIPNILLQAWNITLEGSELENKFFSNQYIVIPLCIFMLITFLSLKELYKEEFKLKTQF